jgi:MFS family permease
MAIAERSLRRGEWRILVVLGVPTFALALGVTTVSTYLPVLPEDFSNSSIVVALKTFIVLYVTRTLGFSLAGSSGVIAGAALIVLVGAVISGPLGDR